MSLYPGNTQISFNLAYNLSFIEGQTLLLLLFILQINFFFLSLIV